MTFPFKNEVRKLILKKHKNEANFCKCFPDLELTPQLVKQRLNPYNGGNLQSIYMIVEALGYEMVIVPKDKENTGLKIKSEEQDFLEKITLKLDF